MDRSPDLPIVYYWPEGNGFNSVFFPSTYLYELLSGPMEMKEQYFAQYLPRISRRPVTDGPVTWPHVAVILERRPPLAGIPPVTVFGERPAFDALRASPGTRCAEHSGAWGWTPTPPPPVTVTVCDVR
jgi:hypothetical protein